MKKFAGFLLFFVFLGIGGVWGTNYTWNSNTITGNWNDNNNWDYGNYPGYDFDGTNPRDTAIFSLPTGQTSFTYNVTTIVDGRLSSAGIYDLIIDAGVTLNLTTTAYDLQVNNLVLNGTLNINGIVIIRNVVNTLITPNGNLTATLTAGTNGLLQGTGTVTMYDATVGATVTVTTANGVTLTAAGNFTPGIITAPDRTVTLSSTGGNVIVANAISSSLLNVRASGNITFGIAITSGALDIQAGTAGNIYINTGTITSTGSRTINGQANVGQYYNRPVRLGVNVIFTGITSSLIWFADIITYNTSAVTLTVNSSNTDTNNFADVTFGGIVGGPAVRLTSITVNGTGRATINGGVYTSGVQTYNGDVTINNTVDISSTGGNQTFGANQAGRSVILNGVVNFTATGTGNTVRFNGAVTGTGSISVTAATIRIAFSVNLVTQSYTGAVTLGSGQNAANHVTLTGNTITFGGMVANSGTARALTIVNNGTVTFNGIVGATLTTLTINGNGTTTINAATVTTTTGGQTYNGPVLLGNNVNFTSNAATTVRFGNTVNSNNTTARNLTVTTAIAIFDGAVGGVPAQPIAIVNAATAPTGTNSHQINANITTTGAQTYTGAVTLGGGSTGDTRILTGGAGSTVQFTGTVNGARALVIATANASFGGIVGTNATSGNRPSSISVAGTTTINANIFTSGSQSVNIGGTSYNVGQDYGGAVTIGGAVTLTGAAGTWVYFRGTVNGNANNRTLTVTTANAWFAGVVGTSNVYNNRLTGISITGTSQINADIFTNGSQSYTGNVNLGAIDITLNATGTNQVTLGDATNRLSGNNLSITGAATFNGTSSNIGVLTVTGSAVFQAAVFGAASVSVSGACTISTNVTTTGSQSVNIGGTSYNVGQDYGGAVTIGGAVTLTGAAGAWVYFRGTANGNTNNRTLTVTTANAWFAGVVGTSEATVNRLAEISVAGTSQINANIFTYGNQSYSTVTLGGTGTRTLTSTGGSVTASGITTGTAGITVNAAAGITMNADNTLTGTISLRNNQGTTHSGAISYTSNHTTGTTVTIVAENSTTTSGNITINTKTGNLTIGATSTATQDGTIDITTANGTINISGIMGTTGYGVVTLTSSNSNQNITIGNTINCNSLTVSPGSGTIAINNNITTSGIQQYNGAVTLGGIGTRELRSTGGSITASGIITGTAGVIVHASQGITMTSANNLSGNIDFDNSTANNISFNNSSNFNLSLARNTGRTITLGASGTVGAITQSGAITAANLAINSTGAITLGGNNSIDSLAITGANGNVSFSNTSALAITGISGINNHDVNITNNGAITVSGAITNTGNTIISTGTNQNITINNTINCNRLSLIAQSNNEDPTGIVAINGNITVASLNNGHVADTAVYIRTGTLTGGSNITASNNGVVCVYLYNILSYTGTVSGTGGIHYHTETGRNVLYTVSSNTANLTGITGVRINADNGTNDIILTTSGNIYIVNIPAVNQARNINFTTTGTDRYAEFRGTCYLTGTITLNSVARIQLNNVNINRGANTFNYAFPVTLNGAGAPEIVNQITASAISLGAITGSGTGNGNSLELTGTTTLNGGSGINTLTVNGSTTVMAGISSTGNQTYNGTVILGNSITFTGSGSANSTINFTNTVNTSTSANAYTLTINNANVRFGNNVGTAVASGNPVQSIDVSGGNTVINGNITTTAAQSYGTVTLEGTSQNRVLTGTGLTLGVIAGGGNSLTLNGTTQIILASGANMVNLTAGPSSSPGDIIINGNISTTADQIYYGHVTVPNTGSISLTAAGTGNINFNQTASSAISGNANLVLNAGGNVTAAGSIGSSSNLLGNISITAAAVSLSQIYAHNVVINNSGLYTQSGNVRATDFNQSGTGNVTLGANIEITQSTRIRFASAVTLSANSAFIMPSAGGHLELFNITGTVPYLLTLTGGSKDSPINIERSAVPVTNVIDISHNITVSSGSYVKLLTGIAIAQSASRTLTLQEGQGSAHGAVLDVSAGSWHMGSAGSGTNNRFTGDNGNLILGGTPNRGQRDTLSARLIVNDLNLTSGSFNINNSGWAFIEVYGNVEIGSSANIFTPAQLPYLVLDMEGANSLVPQNLTTSQALGSLHVGVSSQTVLHTTLSDTFAIPGKDSNDADIPVSSSPLPSVRFRGEVVIKANNSVNPSAGLIAGGINIIMYAGLEGNRELGNLFMPSTGGAANMNYTRWEVTNGVYPAPPFTSKPVMENFVFRQDTGGQVSFRKDTTGSNHVFFEIAGNTMWRTFECGYGITEGAVVQFSRDPNHHTVLEYFTVYGRAGADNDDYGKFITITRLTDSSYPYPYIYDPQTHGQAEYEQAGFLGTYRLPVFYPPIMLKNAPSDEREKYWNISLVSDPIKTPLLIFSRVSIYFSHAYNHRIPIDSGEMKLNVVPYYREERNAEPRIGFFNFDWIELRKILYSFTEDADGDGRLDRIRVQTNIPLNGDFREFMVEVEGYEVDVSKGQLYLNGPAGGGFQMVNEVTIDPNDNDSFYIYLKPQPDLNTGVMHNHTPLWSVTENYSLRDNVTRRSPVGEPGKDVNLRPFDTIPPRIAYTLTLPNQNETYVRLSEPVTFGEGGGGFSGTGLNNDWPVETASPASYTFYWQYLNEGSDEENLRSNLIYSGNLGYILQWQNNFSLNNLFTLYDMVLTPSALSGGYFAVENMVDQALQAMDWRDPALGEPGDIFYLYYSSPKYPLDWGYTSYASVSGNKHLVGTPDDPGFLNEDYKAYTGTDPIVPVDIDKVLLPPYRVLTVPMMIELKDGNGGSVTPASFSGTGGTVIRRVTDVLVSIPPSTSTSDSYFAWPVWARYVNPLNFDGFRNSNEFYDRLITDTGVIWNFTGADGINVYLDYLEKKGDIDIQVRLGGSITANAIEFIWASNIPSALRNPSIAPVRSRNTGGLWLPNNIHTRFYNAAPTLNADIIPSQQFLPPFSSASPLFAFNLENTASYSSGDKIEFIFRFTNPSSDMYIARLDILPNAAIPSDWYYLVRPFGFDIQNMRQQRGGVTILNNVINSNNREIAYLRYQLVRPGRVTIQVYTLDGTLVRSIRRNEYREPGIWTDGWNGTNNAGLPVARGMYYIRIVAPDIDEIRQVMVVR